MYVTSEVSYIFVIVGVYVIHTTPIFVDRAPRHVPCDLTKKREMNTKRKKVPAFHVQSCVQQKGSSRICERARAVFTGERITLRKVVQLTLATTREPVATTRWAIFFHLSEK